MSARPPGCGVVSLPALDLRRTPNHAGEMVSQLLLGEVVDVVGSRLSGPWLRVRNHADGYGGWVRSWGIVAASPARARRWLARARHVVVPSRVELTVGPRGASVAPLFWMSRVIATTREGGGSRVELPDGRRGWVPARALAPLGAPPVRMLDRIRSLFGVPYLWGGRSTGGLDCSGFTQLVLAEQGIRLPRDAHDQFLVCRPIGRRQAAGFGDLVFFGPARGRQAHVGIYMGSGYYAHARGQVGIASLDPDNILCDNRLLAQYRGIGRPVNGWRPRPGKIALTRFRQLP